MQQNLGVWEGVEHPLSRPGTLEDRWSFGVQLSYERSKRCFNHLRWFKDLSFSKGANSEIFTS